MSSHEKEPGIFTISQKAILMDKKKRVLMMEKAGKGHWDLPGGKLDTDEDMVDGLAREIVEETGLKDVVVGQIVHAGRRHFDEVEKPDRVMVFYLCNSNTKLDKIKLSEEHSQWRMMGLEDIKDSKKYEINPVVRKALMKAFA